MMSHAKRTPRLTLKTANQRTFVAVLLFGLAGCGLRQTAPVVVPGSHFQGSVYGGQQPISGATVQLYAASSAGYGVPYSYTSGTSLLGNNVVTTDSNGRFTITGDYTCPSANTPVYLVANGGNPGLPGNVNNKAIAAMAALGPCGQLSASTFIVLNELTTVASVWSLSPFMSSIAGIGTSTGNPLGLTNAFASVNKVVDIAAGLVGGPALPPGATLPVQKINMLADILAACIDSAGNTGPSSPCGMLFAYTTVNGVAPTDTLTAAMNIAQHPNQHVAELALLVLPTAPYPTTSGTPNDFSIVISYTGGGLSTSKGIAADAGGNVWLANSANNTVTKLDAVGASAADPSGFLSGASGYTAASLRAPSAIAIDASGNAWIANTGGASSITRLSADGSSQTAFTGGGLSTPLSIAIDASSNIWAANYGNSSITKISSGGVLSNDGGGGIAAPAAIAINPK